MIKEEQLRELRKQALKAISDGARGITVTIAMDPSVLLVMTTELISHRKNMKANQRDQRIARTIDG